MARCLYLLILLAVVVVPCSGTAQTQSSHTTGTELLTKCKRALDTQTPGWIPFEAGWCMGYVEGVISGWNGRATASSGSFEEFQKLSIGCFPQNVTMGQLVRVIVQYLETNPATLHFRAEALVRRALLTAFQCADAK